MMSCIKGARVSTWAMAIAGCALNYAPASAQDAGADTAPQAQEAAPAQSDSDSAGIVVTGSRIQSSFDRPTPMAILNAQQLEEIGRASCRERV